MGTESAVRGNSRVEDIFPSRGYSVVSIKIKTLGEIMVIKVKISLGYFAQKFSKHKKHVGLAKSTTVGGGVFSPSRLACCLDSRGRRRYKNNKCVFWRRIYLKIYCCYFIK